MGSVPGLEELDKSGQATATMKRRASAGAVHRWAYLLLHQPGGGPLGQSTGEKVAGK